ncbi:PREDICTED: uncharacterized protein LOC101305508 [Fragaria vesca subsp. vesca]|uniref:uncharacterized protein LOC101305508 n=1 Tax=Fragaria vesca subsp. vesca TaxID=101020 RepID=UPI0002C32DC1|nr:PREDICTED: uncharacterized protein LOC101305508 [Fragaria vesca subsp. vesca]
MGASNSINRPDSAATSPPKLDSIPSDSNSNSIPMSDSATKTQPEEPQPVTKPSSEAAAEKPDAAEPEIGEEEEEEEEKGECGFCLFMKGGGCKESFVAWENCIEEAEKSNEDIAQKCFDLTSALRECMVAHPDYYEPILRAEKAAEEEAIKELDKEKENEALIEVGNEKEVASESTKAASSEGKQ